MNIKLLNHALTELVRAHEKVETVKLISSLVTATTNAANNSSHQQTYVDKLKELLDKLESYVDIDLFDYEIDLLKSANLSFLIPKQLAVDIASISTTNTNLLAVVSKELSEKLGQVKSALDKIDQFSDLLEDLKIPDFETHEGDALIAVHLPSTVYKSNLSELAKRAEEVDKNINEIIQFSTGEVKAVSLKSISEGSALFILTTSLACAYVASQILEKLSIVGLNYVKAKQIAEESKVAREYATEELKLKRVEVAKQQIELADAELKQSINAIAIKHADSKLKNSNKGLERAIRGYIEHQIIGISYEIIAIEYSDETEDGDGVSLETRNQVKSINSFSGKEMSKIAKELSPLLLELKSEDIPDEDN